MNPLINVCGLGKRFTLHHQGGLSLPVFDDLSFTVNAGECVALHGPSGAGKSTLLRSIYANYLPQQGSIRIRSHPQDEAIDLTQATAREVLELRRKTLGYVSQFLRVIPRVSTLDVVSEPLRERGVDAEEANERAQALLQRLNIPSRLWALAPGTFSGGEQQRVNIARGFIVDYPILLLDEPTASLDANNRQVVVALIQEAKHRGAAVLGIFHDAEVRQAVADRLIHLEVAGGLTAHG